MQTQSNKNHTPLPFALVMPSSDCPVKELDFPSVQVVFRNAISTGNVFTFMTAFPLPHTENEPL